MYANISRALIFVCACFCVICVQIHARSSFKKRSIYATKPTLSEYECVSSSMLLDTKQISIVAFSLYLMCHTLIDTRSFVRASPSLSIGFICSLACLPIHSFLHTPDALRVLETARAAAPPPISHSTASADPYYPSGMWYGT